LRIAGWCRGRAQKNGLNTVPQPIRAP